MFRYLRIEITCYILYVKGKAKKQKAKVIFHGKFNLFVDCIVSPVKIANTVCDK